MPVYEYTGRNHNGQSIAGILNGPSVNTIANQLIQRGITPIKINELKPNKDVFKLLEKKWQQRIKLDDLIMFCRQMYSLTHAGIPMIRAINGLISSLPNKGLAEILRDIVNYLEAGSTLAGSLQRYPSVFPPMFINIIHVGENTGDLAAAFEHLAHYLETELETKKRVKAATRYPLFVLIALGVAMAVVNVWVIPAFSKMYSSFSAELPWATRLLINISDFFIHYWPLVLGTVGLITAAIIYYLYYTEKGQYHWDHYKLKLPLFGKIIERIALGRFARSFALMLKAGVPILQALAVVAQSADNKFITARIQDIANAVERGEPMSQAAKNLGLFPDLVLQMLAVGEESGEMETLLLEVAHYYEQEVDYDLKRLSDSIEPILLIFMGIMVLMLALGIFLPMWELSQAARNR